MATIRPNAEPAATAVAAGDIFLIDGTTGVRALAATQVGVLDANLNLPVNNVIEGFTSTATAAGTTVLNAASAAQQFFTGSTTQTVTLPVVSTYAKTGAGFFFQNSSTGALTIQSSGGNTVKIIGPGAFAIVTCISLTGTTAASWQATYFADIVVSGKVLTLNNSLTLAGTDGTTMTFQGTDTYVGRATTDTLTNKTLTAPVFGGTITGTYTLGGTPTLAAPVLSGTITGTYTLGGTPTFNPANFITRANLAQVAAVSLSGNPTGSLANESAVTLGSTLNFSGTTLNATTATTSQLGVVKPDGTTVTISGGIISSVGGVATAVTVGTTTIGSGTSGGVLTDNAGVLGNTSAGTVGQALVSNGSGVAPTFQPGPWTLLATLTGSNSATLSDITHFTSAYNDYQIVFEAVAPVSANASAELQVHSGGSFQATSYLAVAVEGGTTNTPTTFIPLSLATDVGNNVTGMSGVIFLNAFSLASTPKGFSGTITYIGAASAPRVVNIGGNWNSASAIDGFQFLFSTGNVATGQIKVYGRL